MRLNTDKYVAKLKNGVLDVFTDCLIVVQLSL